MKKPCMYARSMGVPSKWSRPRRARSSRVTKLPMSGYGVTEEGHERYA